MTEGEVGAHDPIDDDIDVIETHTEGPAPVVPLRFATRGRATQVFVPSKSTPLEEEDADAEIPASALWAMKYRRHLRFGRRDDDYLRDVLGVGSDSIYVLDDGANHRMISRKVGAGQAGLTYYLLGRVTLASYERFAVHGTNAAPIFSEADDLSLCSVYEATQAVSNVILVEEYRRLGDVPREYLPPNPLVQFSDETG